MRLDFFSSQGELTSAVAIVNDSVRLPEGTPALARRLLPSPAMLWAALGALRVPAGADTLARVDGDTLRADIGRAPDWRATFVQGRLVRLDATAGGRLREWLTRPDSAHVHYATGSGSRDLRLTILRHEDVPRFDATIWNP